jgi:hypothetical protein
MDAPNLAVSLAEAELDASARAQVLDDDQPEPGIMTQKLENTLNTVNEEILNYAIADYKSFNPSYIIVSFEFDDTALSPPTTATLDKIVTGMKKDQLAPIGPRSDDFSMNI